MAIYAPQLDRTFQALADPTRRAMLVRLAKGKGETAGELGSRFRISQPAASKHLAVLERAGLLHRRREGRTHRFRLNVKPMNDANSWINDCRQFWEGTLDSLGAFLANMPDDEKDQRS